MTSLEYSNQQAENFFSKRLIDLGFSLFQITIGSFLCPTSADNECNSYPLFAFFPSLHSFPLPQTHSLVMPCKISHYFYPASHLKVKKTSEHYSWKPRLPILVAVMDAIVL